MESASARRILIALAGVFCALPAVSGTIVVVVRERDGPPIRDQPLSLHPPLPAGEPSWAVSSKQRRNGLTGADGRVVFDGVPAGTYAVSLGRPVDPGLLDPEANPYAPAPVITLAREDDRASLNVELWRGVPVTLQLLIGQGDTPVSKATFRSLDNGRLVKVGIGPPGGYAEQLMVPGRWEVALEFPAGYLLADFELNGESLPGYIARLDLLEDPRKQNLTWRFRAPCLITGHLRSDRGDCPASVVATLIEPGGWYPAAVTRGGSNVRRVTNQKMVQCHYELLLPDGRWKVGPEGEHVVGSDPESVDLSLAPGQVSTLNFSLKLDEAEEEGQVVNVWVLSPDGTRLYGAVVEVWPSAEGERGSDPLQRAITKGMWPPATIRGLKKGSYRIVGGHADYLEASEVLRDFDPEAKEPYSVTVTLGEGARILAHALDEKGKAVQEVEMEVVRLDDPPRTLLASREVADRKSRVGTITDATGYAEVKGLYPGRYRVSARMAGELAGTRFVQVATGSARPADSLEVSLAEREKLQLEVPVRPAASFSGTVACADDTALSAAASFRVFDIARTVDPWRDRDLTKGAALALDGVRLAGKHLDRFRVGPLESGIYHLAVRPAGFEYWSWASDSLTPDRAMALQAPATETVDATTVEIECGPLVMLIPTLRSGEVLPDLRGAKAKVVASTREAGGEARRFTPRLEYDEERVFARGLPEGDLTLEVSLSHPYLIPSSLSLPAQEWKLIRGKLTTLSPEFEALGGAVDVRGEGAMARIRDAEGKIAEEPVVAGVASFGGVHPGLYHAELCSDAACERVASAWDSIRVTAVRRVTVP